MKFSVTHPKIWSKVSERSIPMKHKLEIYEKMGGAYRLGEDKGEQVFNKLTELIKYKTQNESEDHEVSMAQGSLEAIIKHANELLKKMGNEEKDIPGWIQDHIAKSENLIQQANDQYHEYGKNESVNENFPGKGAVVLAKDIDSDMMDYFNRMNVKLEVTPIHGKKYISSVGLRFGDIFFFGDGAPDKASWQLQLKQIKSVKILGYYGDKEKSIKEVAGDTYVIYLMDGEGNKKKVKETAGKTNAIRLANRLMTNPKIEGAGWMSAEAWQKEPFKVS